MKPLIIPIEKEDENGTVILSRKLFGEIIDQVYQGGYEDGKRETSISIPSYPLYPSIPKSPLEGGITWTCEDVAGRKTTV